MRRLRIGLARWPGWLGSELVAGFGLAVAVTLVLGIRRYRRVPRTAALVNRADYAPIYRQLGIDIVLSPRTVASDHILRFARTASVHSLHVLEGGAEVLEVTASSAAPIVGKPLRRLSLPKGSLLAAIVRGEEVIIPRGDDEVKPGDRVIVMATHDARPTLERLFRGRRAI